MNLLYAIALFLSALISGIVMLVAWRRRTAFGAPGLAIFMAALFIWAFTYAIHWLMPDAAARSFWLDATFLGVVFSSPAIFLFALQYTRKKNTISRSSLAILTVEPVVTLILLWTDPLHGLFYGGQRTGGTIYAGGIGFWFYAVYAFALILGAVFILIRYMRRVPLLERRGIGILVAAIVLTSFGPIPGILKLNPFPGLDITPFIFIISGSMIAYGLFYYRLLDIAPIAYNKLIETMVDGTIVLDNRQRIVDMNPAALKIFPTGLNSPAAPAASLFSAWPEMQTAIGQSKETTLVIQVENGKSTTFDVTVSPLLHRNGSANGWMILLHDITTHQQIEAALTVSENKLRSLFQAMTDVILILDKDGRYLEIAPTNPSKLAKDTFDLLGKFVTDIFPEDEAALFVDTIHQALETRQIVRVDYSMVVEGRLVWFSGNVSPLTENAVIWVARDITERKQAEEELRRSENKLRSLFTAMTDVILVYDKDGHILEVAPTSTTGLLATPEELIGKTVEELLPDIAIQTLQIIRQTLATGSISHLNYRMDIDGQEHWFNATASPLTIETIIWVSHDITDQRKSAEDIREKEIQYQELVNSLSEGIVIVDLDENFIFANPTSDNFFGVNPNSLVGHNIQEFVDKGIFEFLKQQTLERIAGKSGRYDLDITRQDGAHRILQVSPRPQYDQTGNIIGTFAVFRDITDQKQAELALQQSENKLRSLFTAMSDIIIIYDVNGRYIEIAPTNTGKLYRPPEELLNRTIAEVFEPAITKTFMDTIQSTLKTKTMNRVDYNLSIGNVNYWFSANVSPLSDDRVIWVARDITDRKKVEETLQYNNNHDTLTGLYNRQYYEAEIIRLQNSRQFPISIIMMDVDGLKWVNDNLGHTAGDELLQRVAGVLKSTFRPEDMVARMGGDEFVVILPGTTSAIAGQAVQRLTSVLDVHNGLFPSDQQLRFSIGKATGAGKTVLTDVFKQADEAMYLDKAEKKKEVL